MNEIRIDFNVGPKKDNIELKGFYQFSSEKTDVRFIELAIEKSLKKLKLTKEAFIVGIFDVFVNGIKKYEIGILGDPNKKIKKEIRQI